MMGRLVLCVAMGVMFSLLVGGPAAGARTSAGPVPDADACGPAPEAKPDGGTWECTFVDDFDGDELDRTAWLPLTNAASGVRGARACTVDDPDNIDVTGGTLRLTVRKLPEPMECYDGRPGQYSSASVSTYRLFSQQYGRFEARIKSHDTDQPGLQEAFWLWPDDRVKSYAFWPAAGEIDIVETYSQYWYLAIPFLHYTWFDNWGPRPGLNTAWNCVAKRGEYNTYTLTWTAESLTIDVNGETCLVNTSGNRAFQKPYIMALTSALGIGSNALTPDTPMPATMSVDYVKVWR